MPAEQQTANDSGDVEAGQCTDCGDCHLTCRCSPGEG